MTGGGDGWVRVLAELDEELQALADLRITVAELRAEVEGMRRQVAEDRVRGALARLTGNRVYVQVDLQEWSRDEIDPTSEDSVSDC